MLTYIEGIMAARAMEEVWPIHCRAMAAFGFNRIPSYSANFVIHFLCLSEGMRFWCSHWIDGP